MLSGGISKKKTEKKQNFFRLLLLFSKKRVIISTERPANRGGEDVETLQRQEVLHFHGEIEIVRTVKGYIRLRAWQGKAVGDVLEGEIAVSAAGDTHRLTPMVGGSEMTAVRLPVSVTAPVVGTFPETSFILSRDAVKGDEALVTALMEYLAVHTGDKIADSAAATLVLLLRKAFPLRKTGFPEPTEASARRPSAGTMRKLERILADLNANISDPALSLAALAARHGVGMTYLSELFPAVVGTGYKRYVTEKRINKALELLCSTDMTVTEIAFAVGFDTVRTFHKAFRAAMHTTPTAFLAVHNSTMPLVAHGGSENANRVFTGALGSETVDVSGEGLPVRFALRALCGKAAGKVWNSAFASVTYHAGARYAVSFYYRSNASEKPPKMNFRFYNGENDADHSVRLDSVTPCGSFLLCKGSYTIPASYVPHLSDYFAVYADPVGEVGTPFEIADINVTEAFPE